MSIVRIVIFLIAIIFIAIPSFSTSGSQADHAEPDLAKDKLDIDVQVLLKKRNQETYFLEKENNGNNSIQKRYEDNYILQVFITNRMNRNLTINDSLLPWGNSELSNLQILAIKVNEQVRVHSGHPFPFSCLGLHETVIHPDETISGEVNVNGRYLNFQKMLLTTDVLIYWSYMFEEYAKDSVSKRFCGQYLLSKHPEKDKQIISTASGSECDDIFQNLTKTSKSEISE